MKKKYTKPELSFIPCNPDVIKTISELDDSTEEFVAQVISYSANQIANSDMSDMLSSLTAFGD